ncbi:MAG: hypothetical protein V4596_13225 [Bdellovibrionota bacterium]
MKNKLIYTFLALLFLVLNSACSEIKLQSPEPAVKNVRIKVASYCPEDGRSLVNVFSLNLSSQTAADRILLDTDRDGLADTFEQTVSIRDEYNLSYISADANGDGYTDLFSYQIGYDVENQQALAVCDEPDLDTDRDLLKDCEEAIVGTDFRDPDTDKDGIPDGIEFRYNLNALDVLDSGLDHDGDGMNNLEEVMANSLIFTDHRTQILKHKVNYSVQAFLNEENKQCYEVLVSDIPLVDVSNGNKIQLYFLETENVQGQEQVSYLRDVTVISSRGFSSGHLIQVPDVQNQTIIEELN